MTTPPPAICPRCQRPVPPDSPAGLCPSCVMAMQMSPETMNTSQGSASRAAPLSPEEIAERFPNYEILECLGRGGMGVVYKARQKTLDREVAIKVLAGELEDDPNFAERFVREAKTLAQMSHPNIVTVHDFGEAGGLYYFVMEYVDGVSLRDVLTDGRMEPQQALAIVPPICDALEYAHAKGVVHRDIKPENLLLDRDGRVKIADFGIASLVGTATDVSGTPSYMAPEQANGSVDHRADIYALGVVLYEMLTGERPDKQAVAPSRKVVIDVRIDEIVLRALEREPGRRYQTAGEFRAMTDLLMADSATTTKALPHWIQMWIRLPAFFRRGLLVLMLVAGLLMTFAFCFPQKPSIPGIKTYWGLGLGKPWYDSGRDPYLPQRFGTLDLDTEAFGTGVAASLLWALLALLIYAETKGGTQLLPQDRLFPWALGEEVGGVISAGRALSTFLFLWGAMTAWFNVLIGVVVGELVGAPAVPSPRAMIVLNSTILLGAGGLALYRYLIQRQHNIYRTTQR